MTTYADTMTLRDARRAYFDANDFGPDGGYGSKWVRFKVGPVPLAFPNFPARARAVKLHDLHHVATGYEADLKGEAEISAFEIGAGCGDFTAAWILDLWGMAYGVLLAPCATFRAFVRGRRSQSLYRAGTDDQLLDRTVGELRERLHIPRDPVTATAGDRWAFTLWISMAWLWSLAGLAAVLVPMIVLATALI